MTTSVVNPALATNEDILVGSIAINNEPLNKTSSELYQVTVSNLCGQHEEAVITTRVDKTKLDRYINKIVSFTYGPRTKRNTFYGYVVLVNPNRQYQKDTVVDITCLGVTWPMQTGSPRWFSRISATDMAAQVVGAYPLGFTGDRSSYIWPSMAQAGQSDWEFINHLADRVGYSVYSYNGVVRFVNALNILNSSVPVASWVKGDDVFDKSRVLLDFSATSESLKMRQNISPSYGFFSNTSGVDSATLSDSLDTPQYRFVPDVAVSDQKMAETYKNAFARKTDFWRQKAVARVAGDATITPGTLVSIKISRSSSVGNDYDGAWLIDGVEHSLTHNSFQTEVVLLRDAHSRLSNTNFHGLLDNQTRPTIVQGRTSNDELRWECSQKNKPIFLAEFYGAPIGGDS